MHYRKHNMLIGLSGRKSSGKTTISNLILNKGYEKASFATGLKEYVGTLYNWTVEDLNSQEGKESSLPTPVIWDHDKCMQLSNIIGEKLEFKQTCEFKTRREALQVIGTDILRKHDQDFHLKEFKKRYSSGNFVCDDIRFPNELALLKSMGAVCCFIVRPYFWDYSNHLSETSLRYNDFDHVILNNKSVNDLIIEFNNFYKILTNDKINQNNNPKKEIAFAKTNEESSFWAGVLNKNGHIKNIDENWMIVFSHHKKSLVEKFQFYLQSSCSIDFDGKKYTTYISSPFAIENLKLWDTTPNKVESQIPKIINNDKILVEKYLEGNVA